MEFTSKLEPNPSASHCKEYVGLGGQIHDYDSPSAIIALSVITKKIKITFDVILKRECGSSDSDFVFNTDSDT